MMSLYLLEVEVDYRGIDFATFLKIWLEDVNFYLDEEKAGRAKQLWKSAAERKVYIVIERDADEMDKMMLETPLMKKLGNQVKLKVTKLLTYEKFATNLNTLISSDVKYESAEPMKRKGMYFWAEINIDYAGHTLDDFLHIWSEEAASAIRAKSKGIVVDLWKCVGIRRVHALLNLDSNEHLDEMCFDLPLMKMNGNNVDIKIKALTRFDRFADHLKKTIS